MRTAPRLAGCPELADFPGGAWGCRLPPSARVLHYRIVIRSPAHRLIALWAWLVLLLNGSVDAFGVHACPHHDAISHAAPSARAADDGGADGHHAAHPPDAPAPDGHGGSCTCVGSCVLGTAAPIPQPVVLPAVAALATQQSSPVDDSPVLAGRRPYVLPYATAPPARLA